MTKTDVFSSNRDLIVSLLRETKCEGVGNVIRFLGESGFFEAPSSVCRHHNWKGGLAEHCLGVYRIASEQNDGQFHDSVVIAGILHDICKASKLYYDADGNIHRRHTHIKGHGYHSIKLLEKCGLLLTEDEKFDIRWHMGGHHASLEERDEVAIARQNSLWKLIHKVDRLDTSGKYYKVE